MRIAPVAEVKSHFSSFLRECAEGPVIVTKNGRPVAVLIGIREDEDLERLVLAHSPKFREILDAAERRIEKGAGVGHQDFWNASRANKRKP